MSSTILLLSIKPEYAEKIFGRKRTKKVELRRVRPRLKKGDIVCVYVSAPEQKIVGYLKVDRIIQSETSRHELGEFWKQVKQDSGLKRKEFNQYYQGASVAVGIFFNQVRAFENPISINQLQEKFPQLRPPQSYRYLNDSEYKLIISLANNKETE